MSYQTEVEYLRAELDRHRKMIAGMARRIDELAEDGKFVRKLLGIAELTNEWRLNPPESRVLEIQSDLVDLYESFSEQEYERIVNRAKGKGDKK